MSKDGQPVRKLRWSRLIAALPAMVFGAIAAAFLWGLFNNDDGLPSTMIGRDISEFDLPPIEGRRKGLTTADQRGEVSLVNVWASWCVPCRVEMPLLVELAQTDSVPIHGINLKDKPAAARRFLAELGDPYGRIGAKGRIAYKDVGPFIRRSLEEDILPVVRRLQQEQYA
ncbi:redoxin family protein [Sulfitobacter sp. AS92]|uniref:redoxin family protein n=1 Tax=Sulfitobacter sp. AS92 TaxID=3135783 RepID=UPI00317D3014